MPISNNEKLILKENGTREYQGESLGFGLLFSFRQGGQGGSLQKKTFEQRGAGSEVPKQVTNLGQRASSTESTNSRLLGKKWEWSRRREEQGPNKKVFSPL